MFEADNIRNWRGHAVLGVDGRRIGELEAVHVDTGTDRPAFGAVRIGLPTRRRPVFVPLKDARVGPGHVAVARPAATVTSAPSIGLDRELPAGDEEPAVDHDGLSYRPGAGGERRLARR